MWNNRFKSKAHCKFFLVYHVVLVTKFRKPCLSAEVLQTLQKIIPKIAAKYNTEVIEISGESDHIHFLLELSPQDTPSKIISILKSKSTSYLLNRFVFPYYGKHSNTLWSSSYFITTCGGAPLSVIKQYISNHRS
jgi:putative transposase